jgi:hypothetical protein
MVFLMQNRRPPIPTTPKQIVPEHGNADEKENKWDRLVPPSYSPSFPPPEVPDAVVERPRSEKLPDEVDAGTSMSSKSEIQESAGVEVGDMMAEADGKEGNEPGTRRKEKEGGESRAPCTPWQPLPGSTHHQSL